MNCNEHTLLNFIQQQYLIITSQERHLLCFTNASVKASAAASACAAASLAASAALSLSEAASAVTSSIAAVLLYEFSEATNAVATSDTAEAAESVVDDRAEMATLQAGTEIYKASFKGSFN